MAEKPTILPKHTREEIQAYFTKTNQILSDRFFGGEPCFKHTDKKYADLTEIWNSLDNSTLIDLFGGLIVKQEDRLTRLENTVRGLLKTS
jgi:vacuolar-type H+-ATPase subunit E/Vma4